MDYNGTVALSGTTDPPFIRNSQNCHANPRTSLPRRNPEKHALRLRLWCRRCLRRPSHAIASGSATMISWRRTSASELMRPHALNKAFYLTCNLMPHGAKVKTFLADLDPVIDMAPDAMIMADPGLIMLARERWPDLPLHLSVQANTVNAAAVRFLAEHWSKTNYPLPRAIP